MLTSSASCLRGGCTERRRFSARSTAADVPPAEPAAPKTPKTPKPRVKKDASAAAPEAWRPPRLKARSTAARRKAEGASEEEVAAREERELARAERRGAAGSPVAGPAEPQDAWFALKCLAEKERYCETRVSQLLRLLGLPEAVAYVPRRQTQSDRLFRAQASAEGAEGAEGATPAQPAPLFPFEAAEELPFLQNSGPPATEGLVLLRAVMTRSLAAALLDERSVLGFDGALAEGDGLARGRATEWLHLMPQPMSEARLAPLRAAVHALPSGAEAEQSELVSDGGVFKLVPKAAGRGKVAPPPARPPPASPARLSEAAAAAAAMFGAAPAPRGAAAAAAAAAPPPPPRRSSTGFALFGRPEPDTSGMSDNERWRVMMAHAQEQQEARVARMEADLAATKAAKEAERAGRAFDATSGGAHRWDKREGGGGGGRQM